MPAIKSSDQKKKSLLDAPALPAKAHFQKKYLDLTGVSPESALYRPLSE